jgi:hypothetical protein
MSVATSKLTLATLAVTVGIFAGSLAPAYAGSGGFIDIQVGQSLDDDAGDFTQAQYNRFYDDDDGYYQPRHQYAPAPRYRGGPHAYYEQPPYYTNRDALKQQLRAQKEAQKRAIKRGYYNNYGAYPQRGYGGGNSYSY